MDNNTIKSIFSKNLRELMRQNPVTGESVTQQKLADFLGVSRITIYYYLTQKNFPEYAQILAIAGYFGVSVDYLLTGKQPENKSLRETLHLSDAAINNLESCDKELAPFIDKLLSDKDFFTSYQAAIKEIQSAKNAILDGWELANFKKPLTLKAFARFYVYIHDFFAEIIDKEMPAQGNAGGGV